MNNNISFDLTDVSAVLAEIYKTNKAIEKVQQKIEQLNELPVDIVFNKKELINRLYNQLENIKLLNEDNFRKVGDLILMYRLEQSLVISQN